MNVYAACFLLPLGCIVYVIFGGLRATFLTDYMHTCVLFTLILIFGWKVFSGADSGALIGSAANMHAMLQQAVQRYFVAPCVSVSWDTSGLNGKNAAGVLCDPINSAWSQRFLTGTTQNNLNFQDKNSGWIQCTSAQTCEGGAKGNAGYQYVTMASQGGLVFGVINIVGNFGTVFVDQAYWQRAFAARPSATVTGYLIGGLCWFSIPFFLATTLGLAAVALEFSPTMPQYPFPIDPMDVGAGLAAPAAATAIMGAGGACAILVLVILAVTSAFSAELVAVSSLVTYDIYKEYINPKAHGPQLVFCQHMAVLAYGIIAGVLASILNNFGIGLGYLYLLMGIIVAPAVIPIAFTLTWSKQSALGAICGALVGFVCGVITWVSTAAGLYGSVTVATTGANIPMLAGNLMSLLLPFFITVPISLCKPDNFFWEETKEKITFASDEIEAAMDVEYDRNDEEDPVMLAKALRFAYSWAWFLTIFLIFLIPLPMMGQGYIYSWQFFSAWVGIGFAWTWIAALTVTILPVYESWGGTVAMFSIICKPIDEMSIKWFMMPTPETRGKCCGKPECEQFSTGCCCCEDFYACDENPVEEGVPCCNDCPCDLENYCGYTFIHGKAPANHMKGFVAYTDPASGQKYYHNPTTDQTIWAEEYDNVKTKLDANVTTHSVDVTSHMPSVHGPMGSVTPPTSIQMQPTVGISTQPPPPLSSGLQPPPPTGMPPVSPDSGRAIPIM